MNQAAQQAQAHAHEHYYSGQPILAARKFKQAYRLDPKPSRMMDIGIALNHAGMFDEAFPWLERAYLASPKDRAIRVAYGDALFREGRWLEAWKYWEPVLENPAGFDADGAPQWNGEDLQGKEVLVCQAGGFGDIFMLARYIAELARRFDCKVSFAPTEDLIPVFLKQPSMAGVNMTEKRKWDCWMHLFQFPQLFQMTPQNVLWNGPYIAPMDFPVCDHPRVGIKLGAGEKGDRFRFRSVPSELGVDFLAQLSGEVELVPLTLSNDLVHDWLDTIALISACDLILSVDTSVLHLAAAMGKPTWALLGDFNDAKFGKSGSLCHWYPTMKVFRGEGRGWQRTIKQASSAFDHWLSGQRRNTHAASL